MAKLTPFAKGFICVAVLGVAGYGYTKRERLRAWAAHDQKGAPGDTPAIGGGDDFGALAHAAPATAPAASGKLDRALRVGINTWAGHAPGLVAKANGTYKRLGLDVEFKIIEDPAAKLAAYRSGDIDCMWDTVDSWAREASTLTEAGVPPGKAVLMEDWSRGGDGIAAVGEVTSVEQLAGRRIATTEFTPSHFLLLYVLAQSGLTAEQREGIEKAVIIAQDAAAAAAMFKAGKVDAAVTWEPDLSASVTARKGAHVLVSTAAATRVIADVLPCRQAVIDAAPDSLAAFVAGWFEGIDDIEKSTEKSYKVVGDFLSLDRDTVQGMLSGLKLTPYADNAEFFGLTASPAHFSTLFDSAFRIWRRRGVVSKAVVGDDHVEPKFVKAAGAKYASEKVEEPVLPVRAPSAKDAPILNKSLTVNFTTGSAEILEESRFALDLLGEMLVSFGQTYVRIEGNTDSTGSRDLNLALSKRRADSVARYLQTGFRVDASRFQTMGNGPDRPVDSNATESGRQRNRRTDIRLVAAQ